MVLCKKRITKVLIRLRGCAGWSAPVLFPNPRRHVFSHRGPYNILCQGNSLSPNLIISTYIGASSPHLFATVDQIKSESHLTEYEIVNEYNFYLFVSVPILTVHFSFLNVHYNNNTQLEIVFVKL